MTITKGKLKPKMLEYFREVERTGESLIVTDHGRPVLEVRPIRREPETGELLTEIRRTLFGSDAAGAAGDASVLDPVWPSADPVADDWWIANGSEA